MNFNKDIISRAIFAIFFIGFVLRVLVPVFYNYIKKKISGMNQHESDIDYMIKKQSEKLKREQIISGINTTSPNNHYIIQELKKEAGWGGGKITKEIQSCITKKFNYTLTESKIISFINLIEKKNSNTQLFDFKVEIETINFISTYLILRMILDEIVTKDFLLLNSVAKKLKVDPLQLALAIQIKIAKFISESKNLKDEKIYSAKLFLNEFSEETILKALDLWAISEKIIWAKDISQLFEELSLYLNYANFLVPLPIIKSSKDIDNACLILGVNKSDSIDDIKKHFKKIAMSDHPDKISQYKLPKLVEQKAIERFQKIKSAYEIILSNLKQDL